MNDNYLRSAWASDVENFQSTGGYNAYKTALEGEKESLTEKVLGGNMEYPEYQRLIGRISGIELALRELALIVIEGTEARNTLD